MGIADSQKKIKKTLVVGGMYDNLSLPSALYERRGGKRKLKNFEITVDGRC